MLRQRDNLGVCVCVCLRRGQAGRLLLGSFWWGRSVSDVEEVSSGSLGKHSFSSLVSVTPTVSILVLYSSGLAAFSHPTKSIFPNSIHFFTLFSFSPPSLL